MASIIENNPFIRPTSDRPPFDEKSCQVGAENLRAPAPTTEFLVNSHLAPASLKAVSSLAQDTLAAESGLDVAAGPGNLALFRNPFNGLEEILYRSSAGVVTWVRKNPGSSTLGWVEEPLAANARQFVVAVHPDGSVHAFVAVGAGPMAILALKRVGNGDPHWDVELLDPTGLEEPIVADKVFVQYSNDRPATPVVFATHNNLAQPRVFVITAAAPGQALEDRKWRFDWDFNLDLADYDGLGAIGVDSQHALVARAYSRHGDGTLWRTIRSAPWEANPLSERGQIDVDWTSIAGVWTTEHGAGCVGLASKNGTWIRTSQPNPGTDRGGYVMGELRLPMHADKITAWSDSSNLLHVSVSSKAVSMVHQTGWRFDEANRVSVPVWETMPVGLDERAMAVPLFKDVSTWGVDQFPGEVPTHVVLANNPTAADGVAIYSQRPGTDYWERDVVRFLPQLPENKVKLQLVNSYQTKVTVLNAYGGPVSACRVTVTAPAPVDLTVAGRSYRVGPSDPVTLTTNGAGALVLRVLADGLSTPELSLSVVGVAESLTVQPAADVQKYLSGTGVLPRLQDGLSAVALLDAKKADGSALFPRLAPGSGGEPSWSPRADEVATWFSAAFAVSAGGRLPEAMASRLEGEEVAAFSLQTHDAARPGCEVYGPARLAEHRQALQELGVADSSTEWIGDLVEGLRAGLINVQEVLVDYANRRLDLLVDMWGLATVWVRGVWDDAVSAAHAVETMCVSLGAQISDVITWLTWPLDLKDVWTTKKLLQGAVDNFSTDMKTAIAWMRTMPPNWFESADQAITEGFEAIRDPLGALPFGTLPGKMPGHDTATPPPTINLWWLLDTPSLWWFLELLELGMDPLPDLDNPLGDAFGATMKQLAALPSAAGLEPGLDRLLASFSQIANPDSPHSVMEILLTTLVDVFEAYCHSGVAFAAEALGILLTFVEDVLTKIVECLTTPLGSPFLQGVYEFIQEQAGISAPFEELTLGAAACFFGAFPTTLVYKALTGEAPAPGADLDALTQSVGGSIPPKEWGALMLYQLYCVVMMNIDAWFDVVVNNECLIDTGHKMGTARSQRFWVFWAANHVLAYGVGDHPYVWGNEWPPTKQTWDDPARWGPTVMWVMAAIANVADLGCAFQFKKFIALFEEPTNALSFRNLGGNIYTAFGFSRILISGLRYEHGADKGYPFAIWNCAINVTSFVSAATAIVRAGLKWKKDSIFWLYSLHAKNVYDVICDSFAGTASIVQIMYENHNRPAITTLSVPGSGVVNQDYLGSFSVINGMKPYTWSATPVRYPPSGVTAGLPPGLSISPAKPDGSDGQLIGKPTESGTFEFQIVVQDDYGPGFKFESDPLKVVVDPSEVEGPAQ